jgi:hypothetical protein
MDNLDGWSKYVAAVVGRYNKRIHVWEVWNEGNGGFNASKHITTDHAKFAIAINSKPTTESTRFLHVVPSRRPSRNPCQGTRLAIDALSNRRILFAFNIVFLETDLPAVKLYRLKSYSPGAISVQLGPAFDRSIFSWEELHVSLDDRIPDRIGIGSFRITRTG